MKVEAAVKYIGEDTFRHESVELDQPRADEILVKISGSGICHTDLIFASGFIPGYPFPAVLGHEGSGVVEAVGKDVKNFKLGDHVVISFRSCGHCRECKDHLAPYCESMEAYNFTGRRPDGSIAFHNAQGDVSSNFFGQSSFASHVLTYERNLVKVEKDLPLELLGPLGCGIQTGFGAVLQSLKMREGRSLVVFGGGPVGLSAIMGGAVRKASKLILVEPKSGNRELAKEFGATDVIDPTNTNVEDAIRALLPHGADYVVDTTGMENVQATACACLAKHGTFGFVGITMPSIKLPGTVSTLLSKGQKFIGIIEGDAEPGLFIPEMIAHYRAGRLPFDRMIKCYKLSEINQAINDQLEGRCIKPVLIP